VKALCFAPLHNTPGINKRTGRPWADAGEFMREARAFCEAHGFKPDVAVFDNQKDMIGRRGEVFARLRAVEAGTLDVFALFCHGYPSGVQAGFRIPNVIGLARELKRAASADGLCVPLYCCSTASDTIAATNDKAKGPGGDGGFADRLRDALAENGVRATVFAHITAGHTTRNPFTRVFLPDERKGGQWVVEPGSQLWPAWQRKLHGSDLRLRFPLMAREQLEAELRPTA
jgi:hypothetical protein